MTQCIRFTSLTCLEMCLVSRRFTSKIRPKFTCFVPQMYFFTFRTCPIMCIFCVVLSHKNFTETSLRNVLNVPVFVNTSCNVTLSCCFTSQYLLNTLVSLMRLFFNTSCNVSLTRCLRRKNAIMHPFYVFNTP